MKKRVLIIVAAVFGLCVMNSSANASYLDPNKGWKNITTFDGFKTDDGNAWRDTKNEDNEVEPGAATGQEWDLEGFFLNEDTNELAMVGGFNFAEGEDWVDSGDIFIDVPELGTDYYDYVLDLDFQVSEDGKYTYTVYHNDGSMVYNLTHDGPQNDTQGKPYSVGSVGTATVVTGYENIAMNYVTYSTDAGMGGGVTGANSKAGHNAVVVDVSFLGGGTTMDVATAIECGNEFASGHGTTAAVPEPATIFLLGSGLLGLFGYRKKMKKTNS